VEAEVNSMSLFEMLPSLRHAAMPRMDRAIWPLTTHVDGLGRLCVGGMALTEVADKFGTPAYVIDEADFRHRIRRFCAALPEARLVYAGKALLTTVVAQWVAEEGTGLGVRSRGELATALIAGVAPSQIVVHGMATMSGELCKAANVGVGRIVLDSRAKVGSLVAAIRQPQAVQVGVSPDLDLHEYSSATTDLTDLPLGFALADGHAADAIRRALDQPLISLAGLQCHIGSQVTDASVYGEVIRQMIPLMAEVRARHGVIMTELNIGGGQGIPYASGDQELDLDALRDFIDDALDASCATERFPRPTIVVEPGRAISARAGITLYRVLWVQAQPGGRALVVVDGGSNDNPRVAPCDAHTTIALANRHSMTAPQPMTVVGRRGDSGDEIARDALFPDDLHAGDLLAVACTGAYHHSMASTYTIVGRPPLVAVRAGSSYELVRRETIADLLSRDVSRDRNLNKKPQMRRGSTESGYEALLRGE
jgi:diaminopimelate decarboxylase